MYIPQVLLVGAAAVGAFVVLHVCPDTFLQPARRLSHKRRFNPVAPHCTRLRHTGTGVTAGCIKQHVVDCFERGAERWGGVDLDTHYCCCPCQGGDLAAAEHVAS